MQQQFLSTVLDQVWQGDENPEQFIFILPSRRACTFLRNSIARRTTRTIFAPEIYSIEQFIERIAKRSYENPTAQLFILYEAYRDLYGKRADAFLEFSRWGPTLLADFDEIDRYLIDRKKVFSYLGAITEVNHWYLQRERTSLMQEYIDFWNQLEPLYNRFKSLLDERGTGHQGLVYRAAVDHLSKYLESSAGRKHVFIGFNALNHAESEIIKKILERGDSEIFWDIDQHFLDLSYHDAGYFIRKYRTKWAFIKNNGLKGISNQYLSNKSIEITGVPKNVTQAKYIGGLLTKLAAANGDLQNTAVILADESLLNPLLNALPTEVLKANITMGFPLKNAAISTFFTQFLELYMRKDVRGWYYKTVLSFLSQPYIKYLYTEIENEEVDHFRKYVNTKNAVFIKPGETSGLTSGIFQLLFSDLNYSVSGMISSCLKLIEALRYKLEGDDQHQLDLQYLYGFYSLFNQLNDLVIQYDYIGDIPTLNALYNELLLQQTIDFQGEPLEGLQIMGMLESRVLDFETIILSSINEEIIPAGKKVNSFIPYDLKKELGLPTYKEKDAVYTYHFYRLLQRAKKVYLLYNTEPDVLVGGEASRFIHQLAADPMIAPYLKFKLASMDVQLGEAEPASIPKSATLQEAIKAYAADGFSPTSLAQYIRNPLEFYKRALLKIEESQDVEETMAAKTFGIIIHDTLEELLTPLTGHHLTPENLSSLKVEIESIVRKQFLRFYEETSLKQGKNSIAFQVLQRYIENFLEAEIRFAKKHSVKLLALEEKIRLEVSLPEYSFPVVLKGKIDRIDEVDGKLRILDYKTGRVSLSEMNVVNWEEIIEEPKLNKVFQVLCYAYLYAQLNHVTLLDAGVISFKNLSEGFLNFATKEKPRSRNRTAGVTPEVLKAFEQQLLILISEICNPAASLVEKTE